MQGSHDDRPGEPGVDVSPPARAGSDRHGRAPIRVGRLKNRAEFLKVARGRRAHSRAFTLQFCKREVWSPDSPVSRFGLTVTKKVGGAVERNRIKRRLRAALRSPDLAPDTDHDYVIVARRDALTIPFARLVDDLGGVLRQSRRGSPTVRQKKPGGKSRNAADPTAPSASASEPLG